MTRTTLLLLAALTPSALAYETHLGWDKDQVTIYVQPSAWDDTDLRAGLQLAVDRFNDNPTDFEFAIARDDDSVHATENGENELAFTTNDDLLGGNPAQALSWYDGGHIDEADIYLVASSNWSTIRLKEYTWGYGGSPRYIVPTVIHELGHAAGLNHEGDVYNIMGSDQTHIHTNGRWVNGYVGEDAATGLRTLYDTDYGVQDLGVSHWRRTGVDSDGYSEHSRSRIKDRTTGTELYDWDSGPEKYYSVQRGVAQRVEVTLDNNGAFGWYTDVRFVLSTNDVITTNDTTLYEFSSVYVAPNTPYDAQFNVTVPTSTASGVYYLGVVVNPDKTVSEHRYDNNATYIAKVWVY